MHCETVATAEVAMKDPVFVVKLKDSMDLLLLAEIGLSTVGNVAFDKAGKQVSPPMSRFVAESEREIELDSAELSDVQRTAYVSYWTRIDIDAKTQGEVNRLVACAKRHPLRNGESRRGGGSLQKGHHELEPLTVMLRTWLEHDTDEDVVGVVGNYAGAVWLSSFVPDRSTGKKIPFEIHSDSRALGVASFLAFVLRCGGIDNVRARRSASQTVLVSLDGARELYSGSFFYFSQSR